MDIRPQDSRRISIMADKIRLNTRTGSKHKHMVIEDREEIEVGLNQGLSLKEIGYALHRDPGTISREIRRSREPLYPPSGPYSLPFGFRLLFCLSRGIHVYGRSVFTLHGTIHTDSRDDFPD